MKKFGYLWLITTVIIISIFPCGCVDEATQSSAYEQASKLTVKEIKNNASEISYDELYRHNENYVNKIIHYHGEVTQVFDDTDNSYDLLVCTGGYWFGTYTDDIIYVDNYKGERLLKGDIMDQWVMVEGFADLELTTGEEVKEPRVAALHTERAS